MRVALFVTCLVDQLKPEVGEAALRVLRNAGCDVTCDPRQTCCAQPAFNTGYRDEARAVARGFLDLYDSADVDAIVTPSGSCGAMVHHYAELFADEPAERERARRVAAKTFELASFLVRVLKVDDVGAHFAGRLALHDACHGLRDLGIKDEPRRLLSHVRGAEWVELDCSGGCCGFGGTFSVKHPELSTAILDRKLEGLAELDVDAVVSGDVSCLMQIGGRLAKLGSRVKTLHVAEVLGAPPLRTT
jgi:L-lactate dehydrogenase complex protein LldE